MKMKMTLRTYLVTSTKSHGYTMLTVAVVLVGALGGMVTAVVIKYADNILKGFATSIAIIISCIVSIIFFDFVLTLKFVMGFEVDIYRGTDDKVPIRVRKLQRYRTFSNAF